MSEFTDLLNNFETIRDQADQCPEYIITGDLRNIHVIPPVGAIFQPDDANMVIEFVKSARQNMLALVILANSLLVALEESEQRKK